MSCNTDLWDTEYRKHLCPDCENPRQPVGPSLCVLNNPLGMVVPPQGVHLECPEHPEGHHVYGGHQVWC